MHKAAINTIYLSSFPWRSGWYHHIPRQWKVLLLTSKLGPYQHRSLLAWSSRRSNTLPLFRPLCRGPSDSELFFGTSHDSNRYYTVQPLKDRYSAEAKPEKVQSLDKSTGFGQSAVNSEARATTADDVCDTAAAESKLPSSDAVQQTVLDDDTAQKVGIMQRFRMMYKQYGVVLVCVHGITASMWVSMFYWATVSGVDIVPLLRWSGAPDKVVSPFLVPGVGKAAVIYLMYKLATPARYTVTIAGTQLAVKLLRRHGYLKVPETPTGKPDSLRSIVSDGRAKVKDKMEDFREDMQGKLSKLPGQLNNDRSSSHQKP